MLRFFIKLILVSILSGFLGAEIYVILVSFDGFRHDYTEWTDTPNFDKMAENGVSSTSLISVFPSMTFPNHYSIATGAYTGTHKLMSNQFYSREIEENYSFRDADKVRDGKWYGAEPIWVTAEKHGIKTATYFWVGSEAEIKGYRPSIYKEYDGSVSYQARIDSAITWLQLPKSIRPKLVMLYFDEPDHSGHDYGADRSSLIPVIQEMDTILGDLKTKLNALDISEEVQLLLVSDHGMTYVSPERTIFLNDYIDTRQVYVNGKGPFTQLNLRSFSKQKLNKIIKALKKAENISVYAKDDIPNRFHFNNINTGDVLILCDEGWSIFKDQSNTKRSSIKGMHGYDPQLNSMQGIFYAEGSAVKNGFKIESFENIHIYPLICNILEIPPYHGSDGRLAVLKPILK